MTTETNTKKRTTKESDDDDSDWEQSDSASEVSFQNMFENLGICTLKASLTDLISHFLHRAPQSHQANKIRAQNQKLPNLQTSKVPRNRQLLNFNATLAQRNSTKSIDTKRTNELIWV